MENKRTKSIGIINDNNNDFYSSNNSKINRKVYHMDLRYVLNKNNLNSDNNVNGVIKKNYRFENNLPNGKEID
jgi:hypothetical protein